MKDSAPPIARDTPVGFFAAEKSSVAKFSKRMSCLDEAEAIDGYIGLAERLAVSSDNLPTDCPLVRPDASYHSIVGLLDEFSRSRG